MEVTDQAKAREALTLIGVVYFVEIALSLIGMAVPSLVSTWGGVDSIMRIYGVQQLMWTLALVAVMIGVYLLSQVVSQPDPLFALLGAQGLQVCLRLFWAYQTFTRTVGQPRHNIEWLSWVTLALGLATSLGMLALLGKLGRAGPLAVGIGVYVGVVSLLNFGLRLTEIHPPAWAYTVLSLMGMVTSGAYGALALHARTNLAQASPTSAGPLSPVVSTEPGGARLVVTGLVLLVAGIGVSAASFAAATGGGRYFLATGAIVSGLVQLVRGLTRLGK